MLIILQDVKGQPGKHQTNESDVYGYQDIFFALDAGFVSVLKHTRMLLVSTYWRAYTALCFGS